MSILSKVIGIGLVAGTAVAAVKLIEKIRSSYDDDLKDVVYTVEAGEFPQEAGESDDQEDGKEYRPFNPDAELPPLPNINPVEVPAENGRNITDPSLIADPADFQDWDEYGCRG